LAQCKLLASLLDARATERQFDTGGPQQCVAYSLAVTRPPQTIERNLDMQMVITASSILFGFLFAGYWWSLNRELKFEPEDRHFKFGYLLLIVSMALVAIFGILLPLRATALTDPSISVSFYGIALAMVCVFGYLLTEFAHYSIFQRQIYATTIEHVSFWTTVAVLIILAILFFRPS
jgi:hypothetical protein